MVIDGVVWMFGGFGDGVGWMLGGCGDGGCGDGGGWMFGGCGDGGGWMLGSCSGGGGWMLGGCGDIIWIFGQISKHRFADVKWSYSKHKFNIEKAKKRSDNITSNHHTRILKSLRHHQGDRIFC